MSALIDPRESYRIAIDLTITHGVWRRGDLIVWLTWHMLRGEPLLVLTPNEIAHHERVIPCVVPLSAAWKWDERTGDEEQATITAAIFCANLGFSPYRRPNVLRVMSTIREHLGDLLSMPPMPDDTREKAAEIVITDNATGKVAEQEVTDHA